MFQDVDFDLDVESQSLYEFRDGVVTLESLKYGKDEEPRIIYVDGSL